MNELYQTLDTSEAWLVALITIALTGIAETIYFGLVSIKMTKQSNFYSRLHCRAILRISKLIDEKDELKKENVEKFKLVFNLNDENKLLTEKAERRKDMIGFIASSNFNLRENLKEADIEYIRLTALNQKRIKENIESRQIIYELETRIHHMEEKIRHEVHRSHKKKEPETGWWEAKSDKYWQFTKGQVYEQTEKVTNEHLLHLVCSQGAFFVDKSNFTPVSK